MEGEEGGRGLPPQAKNGEARGGGRLRDKQRGCGAGLVFWFPLFGGVAGFSFFRGEGGEKTVSIAHSGGMKVDHTCLASVAIPVMLAKFVSRR